MSFNRILVPFVLLMWFLAAQPSDAQDKKNQLAFSIGGEFIPSNSLTAASAGEIKYSSSLSLNLDYSRQIHTLRSMELWLEVPALVGPNHKIASSSPLLPTSLATFYVAPSLRLELPRVSAVTPWVSFGGGYGLFETSSNLQSGTRNPALYTHTGVLQFGGGVDVKTPLRVIVPIGLRGEFRDFYSLKAPLFQVPVTGQTQHNLTLGGGITARF